MKRVKRSSLLPKYILLYAMAVFVPYLVVASSMIQSNRALEEEIINFNQSSVKLIQTALDSTFTELSGALDSMGSNPDLSSFALSSTPDSASAELKKIVDSHACLSEVILAADRGSRLYTSSGSYTASELSALPFMKELTANGLSQDDWFFLAKNADRLICWPGSSPAPTSQLFLFAPLDGHDRIAIMAIKQQYIKSLLDSYCTTSSDSILLLRDDLQLVSLLTTDVTYENALSVCKYIQENPSIIEDGYTLLDDSDTLLFASRSPETGMCYVRFLPEAVVFQALENQELYTVIMTVVAIVIALVMIFFAIDRSYSPIHRLAVWIRTQQPDTSYSSQNELTMVRMALSTAYSRNEALIQTVSSSRQGLVDHFLGKLLRGRFPTEETFLSAAKQLGIPFGKPYYAVSILLIEEGHELPKIADLIDIIQTDLPDEYHIEAKDMLLDRKMILVICSSTDDADLYSQVMTDLKNRLLEQESLLTSIGMGSFYDSFDLVGKSYLDSINALDYRMVYGKDCLITPDIYNSNTPGLSDSYPVADLELLDASLASQNAETASTVISRINANIKFKNYSLHVSKYICYDIFSIFRKHSDFSDLDNNSTISQSLDITALVSYDTVDEFFSNLQELIQAKFQSATAAQVSLQSHMGTQLMEYTDSHCLSYDFQIKNMADHFNITPQYMRKLFKSHTGLSISEYISNKRLERAMELLTNTDMTLQDIVVEIGNSDISGFVRFFKQKTGLTPGQYRKANHPQE